MDAFLIFSLSL